MVKEIIQMKLDELQEELELKIADRIRYGKGPDPPSMSELVSSPYLPVFGPFINDVTLKVEGGKARCDRA